jgi:Tetracyclin repressor-like, C-terminal domain
MPRAHEAGRGRIIRLRDAYEAIFAELLDALALPAGTDRHTLRLMLLGAMNWSHTWYRPGARSPALIARDFVRFLRTGLQGAPGPAPDAAPPQPVRRPALKALPLKAAPGKALPGKALPGKTPRRKLRPRSARSARTARGGRR